MQISKINYVREAPSESRRFTTKICLSQYKLTVCFISSSAFWNFTKESPGVTIWSPFYEYYCLCIHHFNYVSDGLTDCWIQCFALKSLFAWIILTVSHATNLKMLSHLKTWRVCSKQYLEKLKVFHKFIYFVWNWKCGIYNCNYGLNN